MMTKGNKEQPSPEIDPEAQTAWDLIRNTKEYADSYNSMLKSSNDDHFQEKWGWSLPDLTNENASPNSQIPPLEFVWHYNTIKKYNKPIDWYGFDQFYFKLRSKIVSDPYGNFHSEVKDVSPFTEIDIDITQPTSVILDELKLKMDNQFKFLQRNVSLIESSGRIAKFEINLSAPEKNLQDELLKHIKTLKNKNKTRTTRDIAYDFNRMVGHILRHAKIKDSRILDILFGKLDSGSSTHDTKRSKRNSFQHFLNSKIK